MIAKRLLLMAGALVIAAVALLYCWPPNLTGDGGYALLDFSMRVADSEGGGRLKISWESDDRLWVQFPTSEHRLLKSQSFGVTIEETKKE